MKAYAAWRGRGSFWTVCRLVLYRISYHRRLTKFRLSSLLSSVGGLGRPTSALHHSQSPPFVTYPTLPCAICLCRFYAALPLAATACLRACLLACGQQQRAACICHHRHLPFPACLPFRYSTERHSCKFLACSSAFHLWAGNIGLSCITTYYLLRFIVSNYSSVTQFSFTFRFRVMSSVGGDIWQSTCHFAKTGTGQDRMGLGLDRQIWKGGTGGEELYCLPCVVWLGKPSLLLPPATHIHGIAGHVWDITLAPLHLLPSPYSCCTHCAFSSVSRPLYVPGISCSTSLPLLYLL